MATKDKDWVRHGRSQRSVTVGGRHFFAQRRCGQGESGVWTVQESDQAQVSGSRAIGPWSKPIPANRLSAYVDAVVDQAVWWQKYLDDYVEQFKPDRNSQSEMAAIGVASMMAGAAFFAARGFDV